MRHLPHAATLLALALALVLGCDAQPSAHAPTPDDGAATKEALAAKEAAAKEAASASPAKVTGCAPKGETPKTYFAYHIAAAGRVSLAEGWKIHPLKGRAPAHKARLDAGSGVALTVPGFTPLSLESRKQRFVAALTFEVPTTTDLSTAWLDLGGRQAVTTVWLNGAQIGDKGVKHRPIQLPAKGLRHGRNELRLELTVSRFSSGLHWYDAPALGTREPVFKGRVERRFTSTIDESGQRVTVYIPKCGDLTTRRPLVVALPGWGGNPHSYSASRLLELAEEANLFVMVPDPRGKSLYIDAAEDGVLEAIGLVSGELPVNHDKIHLLGLSMGGAGALQIGYHYPDRFASVVAYYGDSKYDMSTYVSKILKTRPQADRYSVINFAGNARNLPVLLIHAQDDAVSPFEQSSWLAEEHERLGLDGLRLIAPKTGGHSFAVVENHIEEAFAHMLKHQRPLDPPRVTFGTNAWKYTRAYWLDVVLAKKDHFGHADVSFDAKANALTIHTFDQGLEGVRIDATRLKLFKTADALHIDVEQDVEGVLVLTHVPNDLTLTLARDGDTRSLPVERGRVTLPELRRGRTSINVTR